MRYCDPVASNCVYDVYNPVKDRDVKSQDVITILKRHGWMLVRVRGSHHLFCHPMRTGLVTVPHPRKDIKPGTLAQIWRQAGLKL